MLRSKIKHLHPMWSQQHSVKGKERSEYMNRCQVGSESTFGMPKSMMAICKSHNDTSPNIIDSLICGTSLNVSTHHARGLTRANLLPVYVVAHAQQCTFTEFYETCKKHSRDYMSHCRVDWDFAHAPFQGRPRACGSSAGGPRRAWSHTQE